MSEGDLDSLREEADEMRRRIMAEHSDGGGPMSKKLPRAGNAGRNVREFIEWAREHHARTGEWPSDPLLDEIEEIRREILAENGNDWRKVLQWHREQDKLFARQNPNVRFVGNRSISAGAGGR